MFLKVAAMLFGRCSLLSCRRYDMNSCLAPGKGTISKTYVEYLGQKLFQWVNILYLPFYACAGHFYMLALKIESRSGIFFCSMVS